jgi:hypothetical protein
VVLLPWGPECPPGGLDAGKERYEAGRDPEHAQAGPRGTFDQSLLVQVTLGRMQEGVGAKDATELGRQGAIVRHDGCAGDPTSGTADATCQLAQSGLGAAGGDDFYLRDETGPLLEIEAGLGGGVIRLGGQAFFEKPDALAGQEAGRRW